MTQYPTCHHVKEDGTYCGCPALSGRQYCYSHLTHRARRLRRALAQSRNEPCPLVLPPLEDLASVSAALSEILQALAAGQLDQRSAGLMLYAIQQAATVFYRVAQMQMQQQAHQEAQSTRPDSPPAAMPAASAAPVPVTEYPDLERNFDLPPGIDLDAAIDHAMLRAQEQAAALSVMPTPQPGSGCPVPAKPHYTREESYQVMQWDISRLRKQIREFQEERKQYFAKKQPDSAAPSPNPAANSA